MSTQGLILLQHTISAPLHKMAAGWQAAASEKDEVVLPGKLNKGYGATNPAALVPKMLAQGGVRCRGSVAVWGWAASGTFAQERKEVLSWDRTTESCRPVLLE